MSALTKIRNAGFQIDIDNGDLLIEPGDKLTDNQMAFLKSHKAEIIQELKQQRTPDKFLYWRIVLKGRAENIHMTPPHTLDEMRHIYRGADVIEPVGSLPGNES